MSDEAEHWREQLFDVLTEHDEQDRITSAYLEGKEIPAETIRAVIREQTLARRDPAGAVRLGPRAHRHPAAAGRGQLVSAQPARPAAGRRAPTREEGQGGEAQARSEGAVLRPGLQDRRRHARRPVLPAHLLRHAQGQQPACATPAGTARSSSASSTTSTPTRRDREELPEAYAGDIVARHRPQGSRSPATPSATRSIRSCWSRSTSPRRSSAGRSSRSRRPTSRSWSTRSTSSSARIPTFTWRVDPETGPDA